MSLHIGDRLTAPRRALLAEATVLSLLTVAAASLAWAAAQAGMKGAIAGLGAVSVAAALVIVRDRMNLLLLGLTMSLVLLLHKSFGPTVDTISSGPISMYVTTFDLVVVLLYGLWFLEGRMARDLAAAIQRPIVWVLLAGGTLTSLSLLIAGHPMLSLAEIIRMASSFALFLLLCARLRRRSEIWTLLGGLALLAVVQLVVVVLQWRTGGVLGLGFLGVPTELGERTLDTGQLGRPFGTIIHPVFLGAVVGSIATFALGLALFLERRWQRLACLAVVPIALAPLVISHIRAATAAFAISAGVMVVAAIALRRLRPRAVLITVGVATLIATPFAPTFVEQFRNNFFTDHFQLEVESRLELNQVGVAMIDDHPVLGVGLNNFEQEMDAYQQHGLIFADNPVHNLFLLQASESGMVGLLGMGLVGIALGGLAVRMTRRHPDPLCGAVGFGFAGVLCFFLLEEQLGFSLRHDVPRNVFWLLAGITAACANLRLPPERELRAPRAVLAATGRWLAAPAPRQRHRRSGDTGRALGWPTRARTALAQTARARRMCRGRSADAVGRSVAAAAPGRWRLALRTRPRPTAAAVVLAMTASLVVGGTAWSQAPGELDIVFSAVDRATGMQGIYVAIDGQVRKVSRDDGRQYSWPAWAFGGSHIVYTARTGPPGAPEQIYLMRADGSDERELTDDTWRHAQPKVSRDGRTVLFTSIWEEFQEVALFSLDLPSLEVTNLSARNRREGAFDSDPLFRPDGGIVFAQSFGEGRGTIPTQIWTMAADGSGRRALTDDGWFNTDPDVSPDGRTVAIASYRGEGSPGRSAADDPFATKLHDWMLVLRDTRTGTEEVLNEGLPCFLRPVHEPCEPLEGPGYIPRFTPDGQQVAFLTIRSSDRTCICMVDRRSGETELLVDSTELAINWFDWIERGHRPAFGPDDIGSAEADARLLYGGERPGGTPVLEIGRQDRFGGLPFALPLVPTSATWSHDRERIAFVTRVPYDPEDAAPTPATPPGERRREHFTLDWLARTIAPPLSDPRAAEEQVFVLDADGAVRQITTPWTEDWLDGIPEGDARGNVDPSFSPDGRFLLVTNVSSTSDESFLLRIDLQTREVVNLTSVTSGVLPVADSSGRYSPDGRRIAFVSTVGDSTDVFLMDPDGRNVRPLTNEATIDLSPAWSPDGRSLVYSSFRGDQPLRLTDESATSDAVDGRVPTSGWQLIQLDVETGRRSVLVDDRPAFRPVYAPDGEQIAFISLTEPGQPDIYVVDVDGGPAMPLQVTQLTRELFVDWR